MGLERRRSVNYDEKTPQHCPRERWRWHAALRVHCDRYGLVDAMMGLDEALGKLRSHRAQDPRLVGLGCDTVEKPPLVSAIVFGQNSTGCNPPETYPKLLLV